MCGGVDERVDVLLVVVDVERRPDGGRCACEHGQELGAVGSGADEDSLAAEPCGGVLCENGFMVERDDARVGTGVVDVDALGGEEAVDRPPPELLLVCVDAVEPNPFEIPARFR